MILYEGSGYFMIENQTLANEILETMDIMVQALVEISTELLHGDSHVAVSIFWDLKNLSAQICNLAPSLCKQEAELNLDKTSVSVDVSIQRLSDFFDHPDIAIHKIEFETIPLILNMKQYFYFFACVYPNPKKMEKYYQEEMYELSKNIYLEESFQTGNYKYDVSFYIAGYNHLDYTKRCVESFLKTVPGDLNYELILLNHGSSDGTKEYFESIRPTKQIDIAVNGGGAPAAQRIIEGKYSVGISNDVILLENSIKNLLQCIKSDPKIVYAVPSTSNISNLQTIPVSYENDIQMYEFAKKNNIYDPYRHEQRSRLCNPIAAYASHIIWNEFCWNGRIYPKVASSFPDDRISLLARRDGYKCVLVKDAYCHHFGSVTWKDHFKKNNETEYFQRGREEFKKLFKVDPWGTGFCFDPEMIEALALARKEHTEILGLNCGLFSNPLKIKEELKEKAHNLDVVLYAITDHQEYLLDQKGLSDTAISISSIQELKNFLAGHNFHYIVWETPFQTFHSAQGVFQLLQDHLEASGTLILDSSVWKQNLSNQKYLSHQIVKTVQGKEWHIIRK